MPYFAREDEVYRYIGGLFEELRDDPELWPHLAAADTVVQYRYRSPESQITVCMRPDQPGRIDCGPTDLTPQVVMTMDADVAHRFWLGKVNVTVALARGQMRARGPVAKLLKLVPLVRPAFPRYRRLLEDEGRGDLTEAA
ncbi:MAG: sterol carrier protein [Thermoleophilaceae bacterium]|nr:sterol carrier protein [Thermoleophilaceae bacterium]